MVGVRPSGIKAQSRFGVLLVENNNQRSKFAQLLEYQSLEPILPSEVYSASQKIVVAVVGDSMVDVLGKELPQLQTALKNHFPQIEFNIFNFGVGASDLEYALHRLTNEYLYLGMKFPSVFSVKPDILIIESFAYNNFGYNQEGLDKQRQIIEEMIAKTNRHLPETKIVLASTIAPNSTIFANRVDGFEWNQAERLVRTETVKEYLKNLIDFSEAAGYPLADAYSVSIDRYGEGKPAYINSEDNLHPSSLGGELFCQKIAEAIVDLF